jgi:hypothetical protein
MLAQKNWLAQKKNHFNNEAAMLQNLLRVIRKYVVLFALFIFIDGLIIGFGLGVYFLPIITAETGLNQAEVAALETSAERRGIFVRDIGDSDRFHWGEGQIMVNDKMVWLDGEVAPGPDYRLYLTPEFVTTEADFMKIKSQSVVVGSIKAFTNFSLAVPDGVNVGNYPALLIWCEAFGEFITAAELKS